MRRAVIRASQAAQPLNEIEQSCDTRSADDGPSCPPCYFFFAALPIPDNETDCGEPVALSTIIRMPVSAVVSSTGLKVTETLQLLPGGSVFLHCDFTVNTED